MAGRGIALGIGVAATAVLGARSMVRRRRKIDLQGRVVVVTGASTGLGFLIAKRAAREGAFVAICARSPDDLQAAEEALFEAGARGVYAAPVDVREAPAMKLFVDEVVARFGGIDVLVNNAGVIRVGPAQAMRLEDFRAEMETNFFGAVHATLAAMPHMREQRFGRIADVVSIGGKLAFPRLLPYTASKWALAGFSEGLRAELRKEGILVTTAYLPTIRSGGHAHAWFKGEHEKEYSWFGAADVMPVLSRSAESAAKATLEAVKHGDAEVRMGLQSWVPIALHDAFPATFQRLMSLVDRALPPPRNLAAPAVRGEDLEGGAARRLNRAVPRAARPGS